MFTCPHCEKPIEVRPGIQLPEEPWWMLTVKPVSLGCSSLLAIGIVVAVCSGASTRGVSDVQSNIRILNKKMDHLEQMVRELQENGGAAEPINEGRQ